jgi:long-chain acyl-CoA synthetase
VFTSGTTGQPKGVMLSHWNIASDAIASLEIVRITKDDRTLSILPLSHMFELTIEMAEFEAGASILYARSLVPDTLLRLLGTQNVTCMVLVPQALQLFMNGIERQVRMQKKEKQWELLHRVARRLPFGARRRLFGAVHKRFGGHFKFFVSGGAYLPPKLAARWENMGFRVLQGYGATECSPVVSVTRFDDHTYESIGQPLPGMEVRIAEDGELLVRGPNVALGYWKSPEATAAAFQNGWYHTGDLGSKDDKGRIYLKGRKNNLIVLANGLNVYPEDIENVLLGNPAIKDAVVFGLMEKDEGPTVYGILLMEDPSKARAAIQQANKQLASHQQVRGYIVWPESDFPRTHTLKVKRQDVLEKLQAIRSEVKAER